MTDAVGDDERALRWIAPVAAQWQGDPPRPTTAVFRQRNDPSGSGSGCRAIPTTCCIGPRDAATDASVSAWEPSARS